jgi:hypothetical protein
MKGRWARTVLCAARAPIFLPVPDLPVMSTVTFDCDKRPMVLNTLLHGRGLAQHFGVVS